MTQGDFLLHFVTRTPRNGVPDSRPGGSARDAEILWDQREMKEKSCC